MKKLTTYILMCGSIISTWLVILLISPTELSMAQTSEKYQKNSLAPKIEEIIVSQPTVRVLSKSIRKVSAYNAGDPNQCWGDPCESANQENICLALDLGFNRCAANFVKFGTKLKLENTDKTWEFICTVTDRMNKRYPNRVDIAMKKSEKILAIQFGVQNLSVSILEK